MQNKKTRIKSPVLGFLTIIILCTTACSTRSVKSSDDTDEHINVRKDSKELNLSVSLEVVDSTIQVSIQNKSDKHIYLAGDILFFLRFEKFDEGKQEWQAFNWLSNEDVVTHGKFVLTDSKDRSVIEELFKSLIDSSASQCDDGPKEPYFKTRVLDEVNLFPPRSKIQTKYSLRSLSELSSINGKSLSFRVSWYYSPNHTIIGFVPTPSQICKIVYPDQIGSYTRFNNELTSHTLNITIP